MFHFISFDLFFFLPLRELIFFIIPPVSQLVALSVSLNAVWVKPKRWFLERDVPQMFAFFLIHLALALWKMNFLRWKKHFVTFFQDRYIVMRSIRHGMVFFSSSKNRFLTTEFLRDVTAKIVGIPLHLEQWNAVRDWMIYELINALIIILKYQTA